MIKGLRKFQQLPMLRSRDTARAPQCLTSKTTPCTDCSKATPKAYYAPATFLRLMQTHQHLTVTVGERRWIWVETYQLTGVYTMGSKGGPKDQETFIREIKLAALEQKVNIYA